MPLLFKIIEEVLVQALKLQISVVTLPFGVQQRKNYGDTNIITIRIRIRKNYIRKES